MRAKVGVDEEPLGPKRVRKNKYVPHLAAARFTPTEDWSIEEARRLYEVTGKQTVDRIYFEDSVEGMKNDVQSESVDCVIADPPFGLDFTGREAIYNRDHRFVRTGYREAAGNYQAFSEAWIGELSRVMKETATAWIFSGWTNLFDILYALKKTDLALVNHIIWKYQFGVFTERKFVTSHYHLLFLAKSKKNYYFNKIMHYPLDVWEINRTYRKGEIKNATKLPDEVIQRCVDFSTRPGDLVLDPFIGNGTTACVAKASFRHYVGFELNKVMKPVIDSNLSSITPGELYTPYSQREVEELVRKARKRYGERADSAGTET
jgi:site-specific DNA-methyltransferase (adenine-specific)